MKECANILKQRILGAAIEEANNPPAVGMAIHNAIGKWVESPATPDKVLEVLGKA